MTTRVVLGLFGLLLAVAAVLVVVSASRGTDPVELVVDAVAGDSAPEEFRDRDVLPACGRVVLGQGERVSQVDPAALACLRDGLTDGQGAELVVVSPTIEGDPVTDHRRVLPDGSAEVWTDMTEDEHGGGWDHGTCATPSGPLESAC
jgi:hypothetical protein